jgi:hypothetical protein
MKVQVPVTEAVADVLEAAAEHIKAGWTQHQAFEAVDGQAYVCANGALWLAAGLKFDLEGHHTSGHPDQLNLWVKATRALGEHVGQDSASWNDAIGQTQDHVAGTMLRLAKELRDAELHQHLDM